MGPVNGRTRVAMPLAAALALATPSCAGGDDHLPSPQVDGGVEVIRAVEYASPDGTPLRMDVYLPEGDGPFPGVETIHGGGFVGGGRSDMRGVSVFLASSGYVAFAIDYRLAPASTYPEQIDDAMAAIDFVRANAGELSVDPDRIGVLGASAGGTIAARLAGTPGSGVGAVLSWSGALDLPSLVASGPAVADLRLEQYLGLVDLTAPGAEVRVREASPVTHVDTAYPPTFVANARDELMPFDQALAMVDVLQAQGVPHVLYVPQDGHALDYAREASPPSVRFLDTYLAD